MTGQAWSDGVRQFFARVSFGAGAAWDAFAPVVELRHGGESVMTGSRARDRREADLVVELDGAAMDLFRARRYREALACASLSGRASIATLVERGLCARPGQDGAARGLEPPPARRVRAGALLERLRPAHVPRDLERIEAMLRMWSFEIPVERTRGRLADFVVPGERAEPWFDPSALALSPIALQLVGALVDETAGIADGRVVLAPYALGDRDSWSGGRPAWGRATLFRHGVDTSRRLDRFPAVRELIERAADTGRLTNLAVLSLEPGASLARHADGYPSFASWHLGLHVPEGAVVEVAHEVRAHARGRVLAFDDSFVHSAANRGDATRVVLSAWVAHPAFSEGEVRALGAVSDDLGWAA